MTEDTVPRGNGRRMRTVEIDLADAPMLAGAMRLAAGTALMYGHSQAKARERFQRYRAMFKELSPPEAFLFDNEEDWCEIAIAMDGAPDFEVTWEKGRWPDYDKGHACVRVGDRAWHIRRETITAERSEAIGAALEDIAPMTCVRVRKEPDEDRKTP